MNTHSGRQDALILIRLISNNNLTMANYLIDNLDLQAKGKLVMGLVETAMIWASWLSEACDLDINEFLDRCLQEIGKTG